MIEGRADAGRLALTSRPHELMTKSPAPHYINVIQDFPVVAGLVNGARPELR